MEDAPTEAQTTAAAVQGTLEAPAQLLLDMMKVLRVLDERTQLQALHIESLGRGAVGGEQRASEPVAPRDCASAHVDAATQSDVATPVAESADDSKQKLDEEQKVELLALRSDKEALWDQLEEVEEQKAILGAECTALQRQVQALSARLEQAINAVVAGVHGDDSEEPSMSASMASRSPSMSAAEGPASPWYSAVAANDSFGGLVPGRGGAAVARGGSPVPRAPSSLPPTQGEATLFGFRLRYGHVLQANKAKRTAVAVGAAVAPAKTRMGSTSASVFRPSPSQQHRPTTAPGSAARTVSLARRSPTPPRQDVPPSAAIASGDDSVTSHRALQS